MDRAKAAEAIAAFLRALGREPAGELANTPALVAEAWCEDLLDGYRTDPDAVLRAAAIEVSGPPQLVALRNIAVVTVCPHHLLPAHGTCDVLYLPSDRVAGFGAITRAVTARSRRLDLQEQVGADIAELLKTALGAAGALCRLRLTHTCLVARGPREGSALVETVALAGTFAHEPDRGAALSTLGAW